MPNLKRVIGIFLDISKVLVPYRLSWPFIRSLNGCNVLYEYRLKGVTQQVSIDQIKYLKWFLYIKRM